MVDQTLLFQSQELINASLNAKSHSTSPNCHSRRSLTPLLCVKDSLEDDVITVRADTVQSLGNHHKAIDPEHDDLYDLSAQGKLALQAARSSVCEEPPRHNRDRYLNNCTVGNSTEEAGQVDTMPLSGGNSALAALRAKRNCQTLKPAASSPSLEHGCETSASAGSNSEKPKPLSKGERTGRTPAEDRSRAQRTYGIRSSHASTAKACRRSVMLAQKPDTGHAMQMFRNSKPGVTALNDPTFHARENPTTLDQATAAMWVGKNTTVQDRVSAAVAGGVEERGCGIDVQYPPPQAVYPPQPNGKVESVDPQYQRVDTSDRQKQSSRQAKNNKTAVGAEGAQLRFDDHPRTLANGATSQMASNTEKETLEEFENAVTRMGDSPVRDDTIGNIVKICSDDSKMDRDAIAAPQEQKHEPRHRGHIEHKAGRRSSSASANSLERSRAEAATFHSSAIRADARCQRELFHTPVRIRSSPPLEMSHSESSLQPVDDAEPHRMTIIAFDRRGPLNQGRRCIKNTKAVNVILRDAMTANRKPSLVMDKAARTEPHAPTSVTSTHTAKSHVLAPPSNIAADVGEALAGFLRKRQQADLEPDKAHLNSPNDPAQLLDVDEDQDDGNNGVMHIGDLTDIMQTNCSSHVPVDEQRVEPAHQLLSQIGADRRTESETTKAHCAPTFPIMLGSYTAASSAATQAAKKRKLDDDENIATSLKAQKTVTGDGPPTVRNPRKKREKANCSQRASDVQALHDGNLAATRPPRKCKTERERPKDLPLSSTKSHDLTDTAYEDYISTKTHELSICAGGDTVAVKDAKHVKNAICHTPQSHVDVSGSPFPPGMPTPEKSTAPVCFPRQGRESSEDAVQKGAAPGCMNLQTSKTTDDLIAPYPTNRPAALDDVQVMPPALPETFSSIERPKPISSDGASRIVCSIPLSTTDPLTLQIPSHAAMSPAGSSESPCSFRQVRKLSSTLSVLHSKLQHNGERVELQKKRLHDPSTHFDDEEDPDKTLEDPSLEPTSRIKRSNLILPTATATGDTESSTPVKTKFDSQGDWYDQLPPYLMSVFDEAVSAFHRLTQWMVDQETARQDMFNDYRRSMLSFVERAEAKQAEEYQIALHKLSRLKKRKIKELEAFDARLKASIAAVEHDRVARKRRMENSAFWDSKLLALRERYG